MGQAGAAHGEGSRRAFPDVVDQRAAIDWLDADIPTLIVVGAGVSMGAPTCAPGVRPFLDTTTRLLHRVAVFSPSDGGYVDRLFPEACYGAIGQAFDTDRHLDMWGALAPAIAGEVGALPNLAHHLVVDLASTRGWPVLTTNFDTFLESAARDRGCDLDDHIPTLNSRLRLACAPGTVTLVKLHGSAIESSGDATSRPVASIRSTPADLSRCARIVRRMRFETEPSRLLVLGYSGRDLDLFPWIAERWSQAATDAPQGLWVDPVLRDSPDHRAWLMPGVMKLAGRADDLAEGYYASKRVVPPVLAGRGDDPGLEDRYTRVVEHAVERAVGEVVDDSANNSAIALIGVLSAAGAHNDVVALGFRDDVLNERRPADVHGLLWLVGACSALDRYTDAIGVARRARRSAIRLRSLTGVGRASVAAAYARTASESLMLPLPTHRRPVFGSMRAYAQVVSATVAYAPLAAVAFVRTWRQERPNPMTYGFLSDYLEHWIRLGALLDGLRRVGRPVAAVLELFWRVLERLCLASGHMTGVLHVGRYRSRGGGALSEHESALARAGLTEHPIAMAIAHRDAVSVRRDVPANGLPATAVRDHLDEALRWARMSQSPSLLLKVQLARVQFGIDPPLDAADVNGTLDRAQCRSLQRQRAQILRALTAPR